MEINKNYPTIVQQVEVICETPGFRDEKLAQICTLLAENFEHYNWVGFYLTDPTADRELVLGPYVGAPTEHTRIPFGKGICGQAADTEKTFIIQDVSRETNYLSCSPDVQAEIVLPIIKNGRVMGELDIDSHHLAPFTSKDQQLLNEVCRIVAALF